MLIGVGIWGKGCLRRAGLVGRSGGFGNFGGGGGGGGGVGGGFFNLNNEKDGHGLLGLPGGGSAGKVD